MTTNPSRTLLRFFPALPISILIGALFWLRPVYGYDSPRSEQTDIQQTTFTCAAVTEIAQDECAALVALYQSTNGPAWTNHGGWLENNTPCSWVGVTCEAQQIRKLTLNGKRLTGTIPITLGNLHNLQILDLSNNNLTGAIPAALGALPLQQLDLKNNQLSGNFPAELGKLIALQRLDLSHNVGLTGALPVTLVNLVNLHTLLFEQTAICVPVDTALQDWLSTRKQVQGSGLICTEQAQLLTVHLLAFDNHAEDIDINLTPYYRAVVEGIVNATTDAADKTAALIVDLDGVGDTHIVIIRKGAIERLLGAEDLNQRLAQTFGGWTVSRQPEPVLPDANGVLIRPSTFEYNMTEAETIGGALRWLFTTYVQQASSTRTSVTYVGHGAAVVPDADVTTALGIDYCNGASSTLTTAQETGIIALPSTRGAHPAFTDCHGAFDAAAGQYRPTLLAPRSLARALQIAYINSPVKQIDMLDLFHCFALSLEALVEFTPNGVPLAGMVLGSPNYAFFAPEMAGAAVAEDRPAAALQARAEALLKRYDAVLRAGLPTPSASAYYPRLVVAVEGAKIPALVDRLNSTVLPMLTAWQDSAKRPEVQQSLQAAYQTAGKYDTTYCRIDPAAQIWALKTPDALTDLGSFAQQLGSQSADPAVRSAAQALWATVTDAIGGRRLFENGIPLGLHPGVTTTWDFTGYSGISLYSDFARTTLPAPIGDSRSWQAYWYNQEKGAYSFTAQSQWDDLLNLYWQADDPNGQVKKIFCLPVLVLLPEDGGTGLAVTAIHTSTVNPPTMGQPMTFTAQLLAEAATMRYTEVFFQVAMHNSVVFSETVVLPKLLATGEQAMITSSPWTPAMPGTALLTVTVDPNNRLIETNEDNNTLTQLYTIMPAGKIGDCNGNERFEAGDLSAVVLEIFDYDGNFWLDVPKGTFAGAYGCDANRDTRVDAGDLSCIARLIFYPTVICDTK